MTEQQKIKQVLDPAKTIVIIQADNPDGDSLGSALALEHILGEQGKDVFLYCGVSIPGYLQYIDGWDRVSTDMPPNFDASIIVDTSSVSLIDTLMKSTYSSWVSSKPCIVIDHHQVEVAIPFAEVVYSPEAVATCEVIFELCQQFDWKISKDAAVPLAAGILSDSLGLTTEATSARSIEVLAALVQTGVKLSSLDAKRKELMKKSLELTKYKGRLLERVEVDSSGMIASVTIPWAEIQQFSPLYNPPMLVMEDMRMIDGVLVAIAFKQYPDGKITGKLRCNNNAGIARELAESFGGGGHDYAAGFKIMGSNDFASVKKQVLEKAGELLQARLAS